MINILFEKARRKRRQTTHWNLCPFESSIVLLLDLTYNRAIVVHDGFRWNSIALQLMKGHLADRHSNPDHRTVGSKFAHSLIHRGLSANKKVVFGKCPLPDLTVVAAADWSCCWSRDWQLPVSMCDGLRARYQTSCGPKSPAKLPFYAHIRLRPGRRRYCGMSPYGRRNDKLTGSSSTSRLVPRECLLIAFGIGCGGSGGALR